MYLKSIRICTGSDKIKGISEMKISARPFSPLCDGMSTGEAPQIWNIEKITLLVWFISMMPQLGKGKLKLHDQTS